MEIHNCTSRSTAAWVHNTFLDFAPRRSFGENSDDEDVRVIGKSALPGNIIVINMSDAVLEKDRWLATNSCSHGTVITKT